MRVLLLTRSFAVSAILAEILAEDGHALKVTASAADALAELQSGGYGVAIADGAVRWDVPLGTLARFVPLLVLAPAGGGRRGCDRAGQAGVIERPIDEAELRRAVRALSNWGEPTARQLAS